MPSVLSRVLPECKLLISCTFLQIANASRAVHFLGEDTPEQRHRVVSGIPMGRFCEPSDIGNTASFLASDEAAFLTGVCIDVDGGRTI